MQQLSVSADPLRSYDHAVSRGDTAAVTELVRSMLTDGVQPVSVLVDVIAVAQREVGRRWQRGEWTVAQEYAATAIAVSATRLVAEHVQQYPVTRGGVVVACAEREWHAVPAMIIDCALRTAGWSTTLLGASTNPLRLNQHLQDSGPDAVAVSCSVLGSLPTCRRFIEASTAVGVPILVGGPAFGDDGVRAGLAEGLCAVTTLGRAAKADEIANAVTFLASPAASYINGAVLHATGGQLAIAP